MTTLFMTLLALSGAKELVLGDFEGSVEALFRPNTGGTRFEVAREHATRGEFSLKVTCTGQYPGLQISRPQDWSGYTLLRFDVFNPGAENIPLHIDIRDEESVRESAWANRFGKTLQAEPGRSELELNISSLGCNQKKRLIDISRLRTVLFFIGKVEGTTIFFVDNIRLEKPEDLAAPNSFAFDFGPEGSPLFPGFTAVTDETIHGQGQAWGWSRKQYDARNRAGTPEALTTDFVRADGEFRVDVPDGRGIGLVGQPGVLGGAGNGRPGGKGETLVEGHGFILVGDHLPLGLSLGSFGLQPIC